MACALLGLAGAALADGQPSAGLTPGGLPRSVTPVRYEIVLEPNAAALSFAGRESIDVLVHAATREIVLNALELDVRRVVLDGSVSGRAALDAEAQTLTLRFPAEIPAGPHKLELEWTGVIHRHATGLFALDYDTPQGKRRMLTMQLEPADGRRVAPMWDEPALKAVFELEAVIPQAESAYANMPVATDAVDGAKRRVRFQPTPRMSSYLLHLSVGDLERVSRKVAGIDVGVVARRGATDKAAYALDAAAQVLPWFNEYFATSYPLPKLDLIAAPGRSEFFGAMENWGAILFFEAYLLIDPATASAWDRRGVFNSVAHEIAHQWFGNLVTMTWWDDLWLNEGFATWMASTVTAALHPEWKPWLSVVGGSREAAMRLDAGEATHAIVQPVPNAEAAAQVFDEIAYQKGQAVIRMIEVTAGEDAFRDGLRRYLQKFAYGNAVTDDLWTEIGAAARKPVLGIAHDFTRQPGVPLVHAGPVVCRDDRGSITLTQSRFETDRISATKLAWEIPVRARPLAGGDTASLVMPHQGESRLDFAGCGNMVVNAGQAGYFRTLYPTDALAAIGHDFAALHDVDRLGILSDAYALGGAGLLPATTFLDLVLRIPDDDDPIIWQQVASRLAAIDQILDGSPDQTRWRALARARLAPQLAALGWNPRPGDGENTNALRESLIETLGVLADRDVIAEARARFRRSAQDPSAMPGAIRDAVLGVTAYWADGTTWEALHARARAETEPMEKERVYIALGRVRDPTLARRALDLAMSGEPPGTVAPLLITAVGYWHPALAFDFAVSRQQTLRGMIDASGWWQFLPQVAARSSDPAVAERVKGWAARSAPRDARKEANEVVAEIIRRARSYAHSRPQLEAWVRSH